MSQQPREHLDLPYSEALMALDSTPESIEASLQITAGMHLAELLEAKTRFTPGISTKEADYHHNVIDFKNCWLKTARAINPNKNIVTGRPKRSKFLPVEGAVGVLIEQELIPPEAVHIGKLVLLNSVGAGEYDSTKDLLTKSQHTAVRYDISPATRDGIGGYLLRKFQRGLSL